MGMFDEIIVEYPLPDGLKFEGVRFQTKDMDNFLELYEITNDGRFCRVVMEMDDDKTSPNGIGYMVPTGELDDTNYHGDIVFYHSVGSYSNNSFIWYEYVARFTNGQLEWIKRVSPEPTAEQQVSP